MIYLTMDLPDQPPPDAAAPPPGPEAVRSRRVMRRIIVAGGLSIIGLFIVLLASGVMFKKSGHVQMEATNNVRQVHLALTDFDNDYGKFPDASTIAAVTADTSTTLPLGTWSSNEIFRQLIATTAKAESIFWAKSTISPRKPDYDISGRRALAKGECAFAYVTGLSSSSDPAAPLLMTPVIPSKRCFERRTDYGDMAVILCVDGSVRSLPIDKHGKVMIGGMDAFDPRQPFWGGKAPDVKWPE